MLLILFVDALVFPLCERATTLRRQGFVIQCLVQGHVARNQTANPGVCRQLNLITPVQASLAFCLRGIIVLSRVILFINCLFVTLRN